jgi:predicted metal-binding membrane protein
VVSPLVIAAGYLAVWLGFALAASALQAALAATSLLDNGRVAAWLAGTIFAGAGLYQFSALKRACLTLCQRPFPFFFANWTTEPREVFRLGLRQGMHCLGCCWATMLLMFAVGTMNIVWMAVLGIVMTIEKMTSTPRVAQAFGVAFIAIGFGFIVSGLF